MALSLPDMIAPAILVGDGNRRITLMDGSRYDDVTFLTYLDRLQEALLQNGNSVTRLPLKDMSITQCRGCWNCWTRTPGECGIADDGPYICRQVIKSDCLIMASPLIMGFPSAHLKTAHDRLLPLLHPYLEVVQKEIHHRPRYSRFPSFCLLLELEEDTDAEDLAIVREIYRRDAINFHTRLQTVWSTGQSPEEVAHEMDRH